MNFDEQRLAQVAQSTHEQLGALRDRYSAESVKSAIRKALETEYPDEDPEMCLGALESLDDVGLDILEATIRAMFAAGI